MPQRIKTFRRLRLREGNASAGGLCADALCVFSLCVAVPVVSYTTKQWEWDEAKFQMKTPLRDLSEGISLRISSLDEELKLKVTELNNVKGSVQGMERKTQGNLMVRGLADLIFKEDVVESEYMTTVFVVVQKVRGVAEQQQHCAALGQSHHTSAIRRLLTHTPLPLLALGCSRARRTLRRATSVWPNMSCPNRVS